jgi:hypothetical protein
VIEENGLLDSCAMPLLVFLTFQRNMLPPSSSLKMKAACSSENVIIQPEDYTA